MTWPDGDHYTGQFVDGVATGIGIFSNASEKFVYHGDFVNWDMTGNGTILYHNGAKYIGEVLDAKPNGQGTLYNNDGSEKSGFWIDGQLIL